MSSPVFGAMGSNQGGNMMKQFRRFMKDMKDQGITNPNDAINGLLQSGKIDQQHLNMAQQQFEEAKGVLGSFFK